MKLSKYAILIATTTLFYGDFAVSSDSAVAAAPQRTRPTLSWIAQRHAATSSKTEANDTDCKSRVDARNREIARLEGVETTLKAENEKLTSELAGLRAQHTDLQNTHNVLQGAHGELQKQHNNIAQHNSAVADHEEYETKIIWALTDIFGSPDNVDKIGRNFGKLKDLAPIIQRAIEDVDGMVKEAAGMHSHMSEEDKNLVARLERVSLPVLERILQRIKAANNTAKK